MSDKTRTETEVAAELAQPAFKNPNAINHIALHKNYQVVKLDDESELPARKRKRAKFTTQTIADFKAYVAEHKQFANFDVPIYIDAGAMTAIAVMNAWGEDGSQGHCDDIADLHLEPTPAYKFMACNHNTKLNQREFATLLEDWAFVLSAADVDGNAIDMKAAINAVRSISIKTDVQSDHSADNISGSRSLLERTEARSTNANMPAFFKVSDACYFGLPNTEIRLRLVINTSHDEPKLMLQVVGYDLLKQELRENFKKVIQDALIDETVYIGTFELAA